jgi:hypothetical protein
MRARGRSGAGANPIPETLEAHGQQSSLASPPTNFQNWTNEDRMTREEKITKYAHLTEKYRSLLRDLQEEEKNEISRPVLRMGVGKCFVYSNGYNNTERWPLYIKIIGFNETDLTYTTIQFQHCTRKKVEIEYEKVFNFNASSRFFENDSSYRPIEEKEFNDARKKALKLVREILETA